MSIPNKTLPGCLAIERIAGVFVQYREELEWLANFLTGDERIAAACIVDACALAEPENPAFQEWLVEWARLATFRSAVQIQQGRIAQLASAYIEHRCTHGGHGALSADSIELLVEETPVVIARLDVFCRFVLVICGIEKRPAHEAALLLCVDQTSVEGAYCAAIELLEVVGCEQFQRQNESAAVCN